MAERIGPFSCGSHFVDWKWRNCDRCTLRWTEGQGWKCEIEAALDNAYIDDGTVTQEIGKRLRFDGRWVAEDCKERVLTPEALEAQT